MGIGSALCVADSPMYKLGNRVFFQQSSVVFFYSKLRGCKLGIRDVKFEPTVPALGPKSGPSGLLRGMNVMLPGSCRAQNEQNAKRIYHRA